MKKLLLFITLLISGLGLNAQSVGDYFFQTHNGNIFQCKITSINPAECTLVHIVERSGKDLVIPSKLMAEEFQKEFNVTSIQDGSFSSGWENVTFEKPSYMKYIGKRAFRNADYLKSIEIPNSVITIGEEAFEFSSLESVTFENNSKLKTIEKNAFNGTDLKNITFPKSVETIAHMAFYCCI